jgi:tyrosine-specific transport protein
MNSKIIGSSFLIAGTTIGAGMLALPMTSAKVGFGPSLLILLIIWVFMLLAAGMMIEISNCKSVSIAKLADDKLGPYAKHLASGTLSVLFWALLAAYMSGAASILEKEIGIDHWMIVLSYLFIFGIFIVIRTKFADYLNRILFCLKIIIFVLMMICLAPHVGPDHLKMNIGSLDFLSLEHSQTIPIFFAAFGFHGSIPFLIGYLGGDRKSIYLSTFIGSLIALIVYVLWQVMALGVLSPSFEGNGDVGAFLNALTLKTNTPSLIFLTNAFAFLAITTSFLGVAMGLFDYSKEWLNTLKNKKEKTSFDLPITAFLTFAIPTIFTLFYPKGFIYALGFASMALSLFAIILPCCVAFLEKENSSFFLNKFIVAILFLGGSIIIAIEMMND